MNTVTIAIDAMGGDHGLTVVIPAAINAVNKNSNLHLILVGDETRIHSGLHKAAYPIKSSKQISVEHAP